MNAFTYNSNKISGVTYCMTIGLFLVLCELGPDLVAQENGIVKEFFVDFKLCSFKPEAPILSYRDIWDHKLSSRSSASYPWDDEERSFRTTVKCDLESGRFTVQITIDPSDNDKLNEPLSKKVDLTDLRAHSLILATNDDGRIYLISLLPSVRATDNRPHKIDPKKFELGQMSFPGSVVVFNDSFYAGRMNVTGGTLCFVEYPGIAKIEFALEPFRNAKPTGSLHSDNIHILNDDGQTLDIVGVRNGIYQEILPGGPYTVWVRWTSLPAQESYKLPKKDIWIDMVKAKAASEGYPLPSVEELDMQYQRLQYQVPKSLVSGVMTVMPPEDRM
jgi:hypothetical protein